MRNKTNLKIEIMKTRDKITKIIFQNSTDTFEELCIKFEKVESVIDEVEKLIIGANKNWIEADKVKPECFVKVLLCFEKESKGMRSVIKTGHWDGAWYSADGGFPLLTKKVIFWMELPSSPELNRVEGF